MAQSCCKCGEVETRRAQINGGRKRFPARRVNLRLPLSPTSRARDQPALRASFQIAAEVRTAKRELKKARTVLQMDKLKCRKRVLRRLGFASPSDVIEMKGRVACEISRWVVYFSTDDIYFLDCVLIIYFLSTELTSPIHISCTNLFLLVRETVEVVFFSVFRSQRYRRLRVQVDRVSRQRTRWRETAASEAPE